MGEHGGELASLAQAWPEEPRDLLDQTVRGKEGIVTLGWGGGGWGGEGRGAGRRGGGG